MSIAQINPTQELTNDQKQELIFKLMKELHLSDPTKTSLISNQLNLEYGIKESIDDQKRHIQKIPNFQDATDYILNLTTTGKTIPTNAGLLFEH